MSNILKLPLYKHFCLAVMLPLVTILKLDLIHIGNELQAINYAGFNQIKTQHKNIQFKYLTVKISILEFGNK